MQSDLYRSRDEMLRILDMTSLDEVKPVFSDLAICSFIVIPREERMYFYVNSNSRSKYCIIRKNDFGKRIKANNR